MLSLASFLIAPTALACSCICPDEPRTARAKTVVIEKRLEQADYAFKGIVIGFRKLPPAEDAIVDKYLLRIVPSQIGRGVPTAPMDVIHYVGGSTCNPSQMRYTVGSEINVLAGNHEGRIVLQHSTCDCHVEYIFEDGGPLGHKTQLHDDYKSIVNLLKDGPVGIETDFDAWEDEFHEDWTVWFVGQDKARAKAPHMEAVRDYVLVRGAKVVSYEAYFSDIVVNGDTALVRFNAVETLTQPDGSPRVVKYASTDYLVRENDQWKIRTTTIAHLPDDWSPSTDKTD